MEFLLEFYNLKTLAVGIVLSLLGYMLWRLRGLIRWGRSLKNELAQLQRGRDESEDSESRARRIIYDKCQTILKAWSPSKAGADEIREYVVSIAACYHPESSRPELRVTLGHLVRSIDKSLERFDLILSRPGFKVLSRTSVKKIRKIFTAYETLIETGIYRWYDRHKGKIKGFSLLRLAVFPDPFSWFYYLSKNLTLLILTKYLLVDLYLFTGKLAVDAYGERETSCFVNGDEELESTLSELSALNDSVDDEILPEVRNIKNNITGFSALLKKDPDFASWKEGVMEAAEVIALKYFPDSDLPLEEARVGPLLLRTRIWIANIGRGEGIPVAGRLYRTRLDTLYQVKRFSRSMVPAPVRMIIDKSLKTYGWLKWPLKTYRFMKKGGMWKVAADVGWSAGKKAILAFLYGKTFDRAVKELDMVYAMSRDLKQSSSSASFFSKRRV